jgi:hypothetical protein
MENINKLIERLKGHAEAWEVKGTDNRNELINEKVMAFDCLMAAKALEKIDPLGQCVEDEVSELETLEKLNKFWEAINKV